MQIHVIQNGEQAGPYTPEQFDELLQKEVLDGDDLYWHEGCDGWLPVSQHPAFSQRLAVVLPPPAPPLVPVRRHPASVGHPAKVCWECGHAVSPSAPMCPNCGKRLKMGCGGLFAIGVAVVVLVGAVVVLGGASLLWSSWQQTGRASTAPTSHEKAPAPAPPATRMPESETDFVFAIQHYVDRYAAAPNELVKTSLRTERRATLTRLLPDRQVRGWVGTLKQLSTFSDGKASVVISLDGSPTTVHTTIGNPFSPGSDTSVEPGSALYNRLAQLSPGEKVTFSGSFVPDDQDYLKETSLTEAGAMTEPEFVMRFADVAALAAAAPVSQAPPVARADASPAGTPPPSVVAASSSTPQTPPTPTSPVSSPRAAIPAQVSVTTAPNSPVGVSIKRRTATTEHDAPGDVLVSFKDGTSSWLTSGESCSQAKLFARSGTIGWVVNEPPTNHPGDGYTMSYAVRPCHTLVLYQGWRVVAKLESKLTFIEEWNFAENGTKVALHCRQSHGPGWLQLFEVDSGRLLASASEDDEPLPSWASSVTAAPPSPPRLPLPRDRPEWASSSTTADDINRGFMTQGVVRAPSTVADARSTPHAGGPTSAQVSVPAGSPLRLKLFEDEAHTCRLLVPEDGWIPVESPPRGVSLALEGPGGAQLRVRPLDGSAGDRTLAVLFAREVREQFPFGDMEIKQTEPEDRATIGKRTVLRFSAHSRDPMQRMLQDMPDGPMKQGMLAGAAGAGPAKLTFLEWSVISEGSAAWIVELEDTITSKSPAEVKTKITPFLSHLVRDQFKLSRQFETDPALVYIYVRGRAVGMLDFAIPVWVFDANGLTPVINRDKQAADPKVAETWNLFMDAQAW